MRLLWLADEARRAGLNVVEVDGWRERGSSSFNPGGTICHHTAGAATGEIPSLRILINGRSDLPGPLCHYGLGRSGTVYVIASGRANHAGSGGWKGLVGNSSVVGIEAESTGRGDWTAEQRRAYPILVAAIQRGLRRDAAYACAHREWTPRKPDPVGIDMSALRREVAELLKSPAPPPPKVVMPEFSPGIVIDGPIVSRCYPEDGGILLLSASGDVIAIDALWHGEPKGKPYFQGFTAARIRNATEQEKANGLKYVVVAESGHLYGYPGA